MNDRPPGEREGPPPEGRPEYNVYRAGEEDAPARATERPRSPRADGDPPPEYKVYRSRRRPLDRFRRGGLAGLRERTRRRKAPEIPGAPRPRRKITVGRVVKWVAIAVGAWLLLSFALFMISAQVQNGVSQRAEDALSPGGSLLTGSTILVLGSDQRPEGTKEPGAGGPGRADSIMLLHAGFGSVRRLSILRDSQAPIPGHDTQKINAAYALGGPALMIDTVEQFMGNGLKINHIIEVNFEDFPELIDALGGIDITLKRCVRSQPFGGRVFRLRKGEHHLNGRQALAFARVRKNACTPSEDDRARAARQQQVLTAIRAQALSASTFFRLPWVSWEAPKAVRTDMHGPGLLGLFGDLTTGGNGRTRILKPSANGPNGSLTVSEDEKQREVELLLGKG
jgi:LCP family protein required for cell wall assembly